MIFRILQAVRRLGGGAKPLSASDRWKKSKKQKTSQEQANGSDKVSLSMT